MFTSMDTAFDKAKELEEAAKAKDEKVDDTALVPLHNAIKGALYLIVSKTLLFVCLRDWKFFAKFALCLGRAQFVDKV
jgi:hypothetical protein